MNKRLAVLAFFLTGIFVFGAAAADIDLIDRAPGASWINVDGVQLAFGRDGQANGFAKFEENAILEDGKTYERVLFMHPPWKRNGSLTGFFPDIRIPGDGGRVIFTVGFLQGAQNSDGVSFNIQFMNQAALRNPRSDGAGQTFIGSFNVRYDGRLDSYTFDLREVAGQSGNLLVTVNAGNTSDSDWAVLSEARLELSSGSTSDQKLPQQVPAYELVHTLAGHGARIYSAEFSPDSRLLVTASGDGTAKIWDVQNGGQTADLGRHPAHVFHAVFSPDNRYVATAGGDDAVLFDARSGGEIRRFSGHQGRINSVSFDDGSNLLATGGMDGTVRIWDVNYGNETRALPVVGNGEVYNATISPHGAIVGVGGPGGLLQIWNYQNGSRVRDLSGHSRAISLIRFSRDAQFLASAGVDNTAKIWNVGNGALVRTLGGDYFGSASFSPDNQFVITGNEGGQAKIWRLSDGALILSIPHGGGRVYAANFSNDGRFVVTAGEDRTAKMWRVNLPR